jgi:hypothetical protein
MGRTAEFAGGTNPWRDKARAEKAASLAHALRSGVHGTDRQVVAKKLGYKSVSDTTWGHVDALLNPAPAAEGGSEYQQRYDERKARANKWLEEL